VSSKPRAAKKLSTFEFCSGQWVMDSRW